MFCKNCGNELETGAAFCPKCGYQKGSGAGFCANCGNEMAPGATVCGKCGYGAQFTAQQQQAPSVSAQEQSKSRLAAGLLGIFLGSLGIHNFYLGFTGKAVAQLILGVLGCTTIISAIWGLVEGIQILSGSINADAKGIPLSE